ncbi:MAG: hypothetical protein IJ689_07185 [Alphaproteobacteria bacterium]|nr:hypothetical protein [Alphaproteobacteria bacterium]
MNQLRMIKIIVLIFTFLLIFGSIVLIMNVYKRVNSGADEAVKNVRLSQPEGSNIVSINADEGFLYIRITGGGAADRIIVFNPAKNKVTANITMD